MRMRVIRYQQDVPITWYDQQAEDIAAANEALDFNHLYGWVRDPLPEASGLVLDVGADSGRDAGRLAACDLDVVVRAERPTRPRKPVPPSMRASHRPGCDPD